MKKIIGYIVVNPAHPSARIAKISDDEPEVWPTKAEAEEVAEGLREEHRNPDITVWGVVKL